MIVKAGNQQPRKTKTILLVVVLETHAFALICMDEK